MFPDLVALFSKDLEAEYQQFLRDNQHNWLIYDLPNRVDTRGNPDQRAVCPYCHFSWGNVEQALTYFKHCPNCGEPLAQPVDIPTE